jgi:hypothetical protein
MISRGQAARAGNCLSFALSLSKGAKADSVGRVLLQALVTESEAAKDASAFTQAVLDLRDMYVAIIADAFANDRTFLQALNSSFEVRSCPLVICVAVDGHGSCYRTHFLYGGVLFSSLWCPCTGPGCCCAGRCHAS